MDHAPRERIVAEIRAELARRGMTRQQLADSTGIAIATLQRRMWAKSSFTTDELDLIAGQFGISAGELLARAESQVA